MNDLQEILDLSSSWHKHLCPRQVLGARMGLAGAAALGLAPQLDVREKALAYAPEEKKHYFAQLIGYQRMPDAELLTIQPVRLATPVAKIVSRPVVRVNCATCGEEIINEREVVQNGQNYCQSCAHDAYYESDVLLFQPLEVER